MIRRLFDTAKFVVDTGFLQRIMHTLSGQDQIDSQAAIIVKAFGAVIKPAELIGAVRVLTAETVVQAPI